MSARSTTLQLALDLTTAGARTPLHRRPSAGINSRVALSDVQDYLSLARDSRACYVLFGAEFRLDDAPRRDNWLDPAVIASRLVDGGLPEDSPRLVSALPPGRIDPLHLAGAIAGIHRRSGGLGGWQVPTSSTAPAVHAEVRRTWRDSEGDQIGEPTLVVEVSDEASAALAARSGDVIRLRVSSPEDARRIRARVRSEAVAAGRSVQDVAVLLDVVTVIGQDAPSALFRADLLRDLAGETEADDLVVAGTGEGVAAQLAEWFADGVADGFVLRPGSLPTDAVAIAQELTPALVARGVLTDSAVASQSRSLRASQDLVFAD